MSENEGERERVCVIVSERVRKRRREKIATVDRLTVHACIGSIA